MKIKQTIYISVAVLIMSAVATFFLQPAVSAQCGDVQTSIINCETPPGDGIESTGLWQVLIIALNIMTALVGVAALGGIVYGSALYASAGGNAEQTKKAMTYITNTVIGVIAFALMYALLNFIIPGGIFN